MFKAGALAVIGDSGRFSRQVPSFSGGVFGDSGRFAGSIFWNRPSFADHHTRPEDRVFLSFPKAPPFARWGLGAELTWPAPKKTIPLDPLQTDFLESQRIRGISDCSPLGRPAGRHPRPPSGHPRPGGNQGGLPSQPPSGDPPRGGEALHRSGLAGGRTRGFRRVPSFENASSARGFVS